jgi:hypothetical protein
MSEYLIPITNYNKRDKYTQDYFDNNFYRDGGVIRRQAHSAEYADACNVSPKERRIELYTVLHHFLNKNHINNNEFEGQSKVIYEYDRGTFCICGQNSKLFKCVHIETRKQFYMGSECIKLFQPSFEAEGENGVCSICAVNLRMKSNKKKGKIKNYDGNCKKICNICNPINKLITKDFLQVWKTYTKTMPILSLYFRHFKGILAMKRKDKEIMSDVLYFYKKYVNERKEEDKKKLQKHIKILQLLRHQTNYMLLYNKTYN